MSADNIKGINEKARKLVEKSALRNGQEKISVTISIGTTMAVKSDAADDMKIRADKALYHSKETGRNKVSVF